MIFAELGAVAFIEYEDDALVLQRLELLLVSGLAALGALSVALAGLVQR